MAIAASLFGLLFLVFTLGEGGKVKWFVAFIFVVLFLAVLINLKDREKIALKGMLFCLPFGLGFIYEPVLKVDLIYATDALLFLLWGFWLYRTDFFSKQPLVLGRFGYGGLVIMAWSSLTLFVAISQKATGFGIYMTLKAFMFYFYLVNNINTREKLRLVVNWLLAGLLFQGVLGVVQYTTGSSFGLEFLGASTKGWSTQIFRVRGTLGYPNQLGAYLVFLLPLAFSLFVFTAKSRLRYYYGVTAMFALFTLLFSFSRSAWAGLIVATVIFVYFLIRKGLFSARMAWGLIGILFAIVVVVIAFWDLILIRFQTGGKGEYRVLMANIAFDIIAKNPFMGVGLNNYQWHSYEIFRFWQPVHNTYLRLAAETGIPGVSIFLFLVFTQLRGAYQALKYKDKFLSAVSLGLMCGLVAFLVSINFGPEYQHYRIKLLFWIFAGLVFATHRIRARESRLRGGSLDRLRGRPETVAVAAGGSPSWNGGGNHRH